MEIPDAQPDQQTVDALIAAAYQLQQAVENGQNVLTAVAARRIVRSMRSFFPNSFPRRAFFRAGLSAESASSGPLSVPVAIPVSMPDLGYVQIVQEAVRGFKEAMLTHHAEKALAALEPTGILQGVTAPVEELRQLETDAARSNLPFRLPILPQMAKLALWLGRLEEAERYASEVLRLNRSVSSLDSGVEILHDANMVIGLVALRKGDLDRAKRFLLASVPSGPFRLATSGPNLTLAKELLNKGEGSTVVEYLERLRLVWGEGADLIAKWVAVIRNGDEHPEFDLLFLTS